MAARNANRRPAAPVKHLFTIRVRLVRRLSLQHALALPHPRSHSPVSRFYRALPADARAHAAPTDEVLARIDNYEICKAAFERALFVYPTEHLEVRQGARIILKSKEDR